MQTLEHCNTCFSEVDNGIEFPAELVAKPLAIEDYVQLGLAQNPVIAEARYKIQAKCYRVPQELALPDPIVNTTTHLAPVETAAGQQSFAFGISQKIINLERRATKGSIAMEEVRAAKAELEKTRFEVAEKIRVACYQLLYVRNAILITAEDIESLATIAEVVLRRYEVKKSVSQQDVLNVQIEQSAAENRLTELTQLEKSYRARLARLVHIAPSSDLQILDELKITENQFDLDALTIQAIEARPELAAQLSNIRRDRKKIHLACLQYKPDFTIGLNWIATSTGGISPVANGDDAVLLGVGFNWPIYKDRIRAAVNEAKASRRASSSRYEGLKDQVFEEVFDLIAKAESTRETLSLLQEDIIPKATRTLNLSIDEYSTGDVEYVQLIENWRSLLHYRITESRLVSEYNQTIASLSRSVGEPIEVTTESE